MGESLNAGNELDNEELFGEVTPGEMPDFDGEIKLVTAFEHRIEDLERLAESIEQTGGMNQNFAMEAERILPGFLHEKAPLGYYSKDTSATRLRVSMEEITKGMWALIAAGVAAALALVVKLISWFRGRGKDGDAAGGGGGGDRAEAHEKASDTAAEIKRVMETTGREKTEDGDSLQNVAKDLQIRRDTEIYMFLREQNEAVSEILSGKTLHRALSKLCEQLPRVTALFAQKNELLNKFIIEDIAGIRTHTRGDVHDKSVELTASVTKRQIMTPIPVAPLTEHIKGGLGDIARILAEDFHVKQKQPHKIGDNYDNVLRELAKAMADDGIVRALKERAEAEEVLERYKSDLEGYQKRFALPEGSAENSDEAELSVELGKGIREAITFTLQEVTSLVRLYHIVGEASRMMIEVVEQSRHVMESLIKELESRAKNGGYEVPEDVKKLKERLKELKKK